jgi:hypothetical protein
MFKYVVIGMIIMNTFCLESKLNNSISYSYWKKVLLCLIYLLSVIQNNLQDQKFLM